MNEMILYLEKDRLPNDVAKAKKIALESSQYKLLDGILYHTTSVQSETLCGSTKRVKNSGNSFWEAFRSFA